MTQPSPQGVIATDGLSDAREAERLPSYLRGIWERRHYISYVSKAALRTRQINSVLGNLWHLLNPLLQIGVFFLFFGLVLDTTRGVDNFLGYLSIGIFVYSYSQKCAITGARSLVKYRGLMKMVSFPRATLPITTTVTEALATIPPFAVMFVVALLTGEPVSASWLLVIPFFVVQTAFNAGLAMITARSVSHLADVQQVLPFIFRLGFYFSGVLFNVNAYVDGKSYEIIFRLNPLYCFLEIYRGAVLEGNVIDWQLAMIAGAWSAVLLVGGLWWFRRAEDSYGEG
ncbi:MAG: ABC transporter permease [Ilumatobacteraceae bacterium]|nr:ABC transporter permease [Ilumatobacteraceae bacterium]